MLPRSARISSRGLQEGTEVTAELRPRSVRRQLNQQKSDPEKFANRVHLGVVWTAYHISTRERDESSSGPQDTVPMKIEIYRKLTWHLRSVQSIHQRHWSKISASEISW